MAVRQLDAEGEHVATFAPPAIPGTTARPPRLPAGTVDRPALRARLQEVRDGVVSVVAPAGCGKSTTTLLWAAADPRPVVWASLGPSDDDALHLVQHVAFALHQVWPLPEATSRLLQAPGRSPELDLVPALATALEQAGPLLLVLDDVHLVGSARARTCLDGLLGLRPPTTTVALLGRAQPAHLARLRLEGDLVELGADELAVDVDTASELLEAAGVTLGPDEVDELVARTEGWAAGLQLAAILRRQPDGAGDGLSGRHRLVADYLVEEVLDRLPEERITFLEDASVLAELEAGQLDRLLGRTDSAAVLHEVEQGAGVFLVPLDEERRRYRFHHLFGELLEQRLADRDPQRRTGLHRAAAALAAASGDSTTAVRHSVAAGDLDGALHLLCDEAARLTVNAQLERFGARLALIGDEAIDERPAAAFLWAWYGLNVGEPDLAWRAFGALRAADPDEVLGDGPLTVGLAVHLVAGMVAMDGIAQVVVDEEVVRRSVPPGSEWWAIASVVEGAALLHLGRLEESQHRFERLLPEVSTRMPVLEAFTVAHLALFELESGDLETARSTSRRAIDLAEEHDLEGVSSVVVVFAIAALVAARSGRADEARRHMKATQRMLARLGSLAPRTHLAGNVLLARSALAIADPAEARVLADEAHRVQRREPGAVQLNTWLEDVDEQLAAGEGRDLLPDQALTPAELRLLPHLATHLSLQEISDRLHVSRNTAKSQTVAIYRKLGVQSRSAAVEAARRRGYLAG